MKTCVNYSLRLTKTRLNSLWLLSFEPDQFGKPERLQPVSVTILNHLAEISKITQQAP